MIMMMMTATTMTILSEIYYQLPNKICLYVFRRNKAVGLHKVENVFLFDS